MLNLCVSVDCSPAGSSPGCVLCPSCSSLWRGHTWVPGAGQQVRTALFSPPPQVTPPTPWPRVSFVVLIKAVKSDSEMASEKSPGQKSCLLAAHWSYFNSSKMEIGLKCICSDAAEALSHSWGKAAHMHLFGLLFHFPFYHESPLKCLFDWNRPCCSHTLLRLLSIPQLPPVWSLFSFCSSAAELLHCLASLLLSSLITYLHSFSLIQHQMKEPPTPIPAIPPHIHLVSLLVFVCFMLAPDGESWGVFCAGRYKTPSQL